MMHKYIEFIKALRKERGFSQSDVAVKLGISRTSYISIEQGKRELSLSEADKLAEIFGVSLQDFERGESPNYEKYRQMILAFLRLNKSVTKTKLAKLLYFADFGWYYSHLKSMSGMPYRKIQFGPVADTYFRLIDEMYENGDISIEKTGNGAMLVSQSRSGAKDELNEISKEEAGLIEKIDQKWKGKRTEDIVRFTHKQMPYMFAEDNEIVSYDIFTQEDPSDIY